MGLKRAALAVAHSICHRVWIVRARGELYVYADLGVDYFNRREVEAVKRCALKRFTDLGYHVAELELGVQRQEQVEILKRPVTSGRLDGDQWLVDIWQQVNVLKTILA